VTFNNYFRLDNFYYYYIRRIKNNYHDTKHAVGDRCLRPRIWYISSAYCKRFCFQYTRAITGR